MTNIAEEVDPNRHLLGAYSLASSRASTDLASNTSIFIAGFWNYLREDITYSLIEQTPIKMDLAGVNAAHDGDDPHFLNSSSLLLGNLINLAFGTTQSLEEYNRLKHLVEEWRNALPPRCIQYAETHENQPQICLPNIWFYQDFHGRFRWLFPLLLTLTFEQ